MKSEKIIVLFTLCVLIGTIIRVIILNSELKTTNKYYLKETQRLEQLLNHQINKDRLERLNENLTLNSELQIKDINDKIHKIKDVIKSPTLVFRYSVLNCSACVNAEINNIRELNVDLNVMKTKILFIGYYEDIRSQIYAFKSMKLNIPIYILPTNNIGLPIEENNNIPYYFVLNSDLSIRNVFVPEKECPGLTKEYLKMVIDRVLK